MLHASTASLLAPNLQLIAKGEPGSDEQTCALASLVLALAVHSERKERHIERIQGFDESVQRELMYAIDSVDKKVGGFNEKGKDSSKELE